MAVPTVFDTIIKFHNFNFASSCLNHLYTNQFIVFNRKENEQSEDDSSDSEEEKKETVEEVKATVEEEKKAK